MIRENFAPESVLFAVTVSDAVRLLALQDPYIREKIAHMTSTDTIPITINFGGATKEFMLLADEVQLALSIQKLLG